MEKKLSGSKISTILKWLDNNILLILAGFLIAFIPLYPKLPLFEAIPGYIVRVRLEDIFVSITVFIWLIQLIRKKVRWQSIILPFILLYALTGLLSILSALFVIKTVPLELLHVSKTVLHFFRYLEYFSLFFIVYSAVKSKKDISLLLKVFALTVVAAAIYGFGQKFFYWPVYSTMNREFSKGIRLYLTEHARVQSTFGGHYDMAAYLVVVLPVMLALGYLTKKKIVKFGFQIVQLLGLWLLIVSASRNSFIAYIFASLVVITLIALRRYTLKERVKWFISRSTIFGLAVFIMMSFFGEDIYERFLQALEGFPEYRDAYHSWNGQRKIFFAETLAKLGLKKLGPPENSMSLDEVLTATDERPTPDRPSDVYVDVPDKIKVATTSADGKQGFVIKERDRTWSDNALKYGLSVAIRFDSLWPNAIKGFKRNPLVGSGYATLNKEGFSHFIEADSTDNNFLRTLGETGLLGFIFFYGIVIIVIKKALKYFKNQQNLQLAALSIGLVAASLGLLANALYIDVFAASKVAFTYWSLVGLVLGSIAIFDNHSKTSEKSTKNKLAQKKRRNK